MLTRLVLQFRRGFRRNDKPICLSSTRFIAHLVNQQVVIIKHNFYCSGAIFNFSSNLGSRSSRT